MNRLLYKHKFEEAEKFAIAFELDVEVKNKIERTLASRPCNFESFLVFTSFQFFDAHLFNSGYISQGHFGGVQGKKAPKFVSLGGKMIISIFEITYSNMFMPQTF